MTATGCASEDELLALVTGGASATLRARIEAHVASCEECRTTLSALARLDAGARSDAPAEAATMPARGELPEGVPRAVPDAGASTDAWAPGTRVGRFVVR